MQRLPDDLHNVLLTMRQQERDIPAPLIAAFDINEDYVEGFWDKPFDSTLIWGDHHEYELGFRWVLIPPENAIAVERLLLMGYLQPVPFDVFEPLMFSALGRRYHFYYDSHAVPPTFTEAEAVYIRDIAT